MKKAFIIIGGSILLIGGVAYYFLTKKDKDQPSLPTDSLDTLPSGTTSTSASSSSLADSVIAPLPSVVKTYSAEDLKAINLLKDTIIADMRRKGTYKRSASRNAVQRDIDKNMELLRGYKYTLDNKNQLVKIA